jgi:hypothetical protein
MDMPITPLDTGLLVPLKVEREREKRGRKGERERRQPEREERNKERRKKLTARQAWR